MEIYLVEIYFVAHLVNGGLGRPYLLQGVTSTLLCGGGTWCLAHGIVGRVNSMCNTWNVPLHDLLGCSRTAAGKRLCERCGHLPTCEMKIWIAQPV